MKVTLTNVRLAFPQLFEAATVNGEGEPAFSCSLIFGPKHPAKKLMEEAIEATGKEKWGAKWEAVKKELTAKDRTALHDGDLKTQYSGFEGNYYVSARNSVRPLVIDRNKSPLTAQDGKVYAGCYVNAVLEIWAQDNSFGKRVNASIKGVQFYADGDAFSGGGSASADDFEDLSEGADADDMLG